MVLISLIYILHTLYVSSTTSVGCFERKSYSGSARLFFTPGASSLARTWTTDDNAGVFVCLLGSWGNTL